MDCNEIQPNLMDYILGRLTRSEIEEIRTHLTVCEECRSIFGEEQALCSRFSEMSQASPGNDVWTLIRSRTRPRATIFRLLQTRVGRLLAGAVAAAAVAFAVVSMQPGEQVSKIDNETVHAVAAIMMTQPERSSDDPLGSSSDALAAAIDEGT